MWNKRREEEPPKPTTSPAPSAVAPSAPAPTAPKPIEPKKETPMSSMPMGKIEPESRGGSATIGKAVKIVGQIYSKEELFVDGDLEGTLEALEHRLTIGPNGTVHAAVKAREVVVLGSIQGNVEAADKIEIRKDAKLVGDIRTARIVIEDGAYFKGSIDIVKGDALKNAPKPQVSQPAPAAPSPAPAAAGVSGNPR
jgi:cytoskeletal protein CcmA (bactofilin family)